MRESRDPSRPISTEGPATPYTHGHHVHGRMSFADPSNERGLWAVKLSLFGLLATAMLQVVVVGLSGSVALFADTIHNFGDALTAVPLWIAFRLSRLKPTDRFPYGYGKVEDLAGAAVVLLILFSAVVTGVESIRRMLQPQPVQYLGAVAAAAVIGFLGNELVALFRIRVGQEIHSAALVADGYHARADGLTSLAVLGGAAGVWLGFPLADPLVGLLITGLIVRILWSSAGMVFLRMIDGVDPAIADEIREAAMQVGGVEGVSDVRVRWIGHRLHAEVNLAVGGGLSVQEAHTLAQEARHAILHQLPHFSNAILDVDPAGSSGEHFHRVENHAHGDLQPHFHP